MNSIILYFYPNTRRTKHTPDDSPIVLKGKVFGYIRCELHKNSDCVNAIATAEPIADETLLNSVELS